MFKHSGFRSRLYLISSILLSIALLFTSTSVWSGEKTIIDDPKTWTLIDGVKKGLESWASKGNSTRSASGSIGEILVSSDKAICGGWTIIFRQKYYQLVIDKAPDQLLSDMKQLVDKVNGACDKIINPENPPPTPKPFVPDRNDCPECDENRERAHKVRYELELAEYQWERAARVTDHWIAAKKPDDESAQKYLQDLIRTAEKNEGELGVEVEKKKGFKDLSERLLNDCLERCLNATEGDSKSIGDILEPSYRHDDQVIVSMNHTDDVATLYINGKAIFESKWGVQGPISKMANSEMINTTGGRQGNSGPVDVTPYLQEGRNLLRITLENFAFEAGGASINAEVRQGSKILFSKSFAEPNEDAGILLDQEIEVHFPARN